MNSLAETVQVRLNTAMKQRLEQEAHLRQLKVSQLVRLVLAEWLVNQTASSTHLVDGFPCVPITEGDEKA